MGNASGGAGTLTALLQSEGIIPHVVSNNTVTLAWRIESMADVKFTGGYWENFAETMQKNVYTLLDAPKMPWNDGGGGEGSYPWFGALEFVIGPAKDNKTCGTAGIADAHEAMRKITEYLFNKHGGVYDTAWGKASYANIGSLQLTGFKYKSYIGLHEGRLINCFDQAGALYISGRLAGVDCSFYLMEPFGAIKPTYLVGYSEQLCNNPFYLNPRINSSDSYMRVYVNDESVRRSSFARHAFVLLGKHVYDACAGPALGKSKAKYIDDAIDVAYYLTFEHFGERYGDLTTLEQSNRAVILEKIHE